MPGRLKVPKPDVPEGPAMDPNTVCNCKEMGLRVQGDPTLMHLIWRNSFGQMHERYMHNVYAEVTIYDGPMLDWIGRGVADITCTHRKSGSYDGIEHPQYCNDGLTTLTLKTDNGTWVYKVARRGDFSKGETYWRWPD